MLSKQLNIAVIFIINDIDCEAYFPFIIWPWHDLQQQSNLEDITY